MRNEELERAIVAAPDDLTARMVYGDWLQDQGSELGPWIAMWSAMEKRPDDLVLRAAALEYQADNQEALFGDGLEAIRRGYVGWKGGFVDELRVMKEDATTPAAIAALLARPIVKFVHHIAIEDKDAPIGAIVDAIVDAELPLLDELLVFDDIVANRPAIQVDAIAKLPLRRLALSNVTVGVPMPTLRELFVAFGWEAAVAWIEGGGCPALEKVTFVETAVVDEDALARRLPGVTIARLDAQTCYGMPQDVEHNPLGDFVRAGDRATLRMIPAAGVPIYNLGTVYLQTNLRDAVTFCDLAATLPAGDMSHELNAAIAHEKAGEPIHAELCARAALIGQPGDEGFYEILIDALRQQRRFADAFRLWPKAKAAIGKPVNDDGQHRDRACLLDMMMTCVFAGKVDEARALAKEFPRLVDDRHHALFAIVAMDAGDAKLGRAAWAKVKSKTKPVEGIVHHARALFVFEDEGGGVAAQQAMVSARQQGYTDLAWMADTCQRAGIRFVSNPKVARPPPKSKPKRASKPAAKSAATSKPKRASRPAAKSKPKSKPKPTSKRRSK